VVGPGWLILKLPRGNLTASLVLPSWSTPEAEKTPLAMTGILVAIPEVPIRQKCPRGVLLLATHVLELAATFRVAHPLLLVLDGVGARMDSGMQDGPVDELLGVAVERPALDQLEVEVGRSLEDRVQPCPAGDHGKSVTWTRSTRPATTGRAHEPGPGGSGDLGVLLSGRWT
jgi:hypothetical protein